jgi:hypothetical protein
MATVRARRSSARTAIPAAVSKSKGERGGRGEARPGLTSGRDGLEREIDDGGRTPAVAALSGDAAKLREERELAGELRGERRAARAAFIGGGEGEVAGRRVAQGAHSNGGRDACSELGGGRWRPAGELWWRCPRRDGGGSGSSGAGVLRRR